MAGTIDASIKQKRYMTMEKIKDYNELYEYVKTNVMGYNQNQDLSKNMVLRLKGLQEGKFMQNKKIKAKAEYSCKVILNTFKFCTFEIQQGLKNNSFKDENHKFNYVLKIVESNLNTIYMKMKNAEKVKESELIIH